MTKKKGNKKSGKRQEKDLSKQNQILADKKSAEVMEKAREVPSAGDDSVGEMLNNALILDESTEIVVVTNSNFQNNNEKQQMQMITPPQQTKNKGKQESKNSNFITDQDVGTNNSNKKSSSSRNYSYTSGGDNSWMEKDPFEVSYSRSIEYCSGKKKGTKYVVSIINHSALQCLFASVLGKETLLLVEN